MKTFFRVSIALVAFTLISGFSASGQKFGYINIYEILQSMPEMKDVQTKLEATGKDMEEQWESMQVEYNNKFEDYAKTRDNLSDGVRQIKEQELQQFGQRMEEFNQNAPTLMQQEESKLVAPLYEKAQEAVNKVAKANSLTAVFEVATGALSYVDENQMVNLVPLVQKELGIAAN